MGICVSARLCELCALSRVTLLLAGGLAAACSSGGSGATASPESLAGSGQQTTLLPDAAPPPTGVVAGARATSSDPGAGGQAGHAGSVALAGSLPGLSGGGGGGAASGPGSSAGRGGFVTSSGGAASLAGAGAGPVETGGGPPAGGAGGGRASAGAAGSADTGTEIAAGDCVLEVPESLAELTGLAFFDHPWPSDFRRDAQGLLDLSGFPNPTDSSLLQRYVAEVDGDQNGFSPAAAGYLRFRVPIDPSSLPPDPEATVAEDSSVQLLDVDPASPTRGERQLISLSFRGDEDLYWGDNTLMFMPTPGFPLREDTRYALVATDALTTGGRPLTACAKLREVLGTDPASGAAAALRDQWAEAVAELELAGISSEHVVHLAVFTTGLPTLSMRRIRDWAISMYPEPSVTEMVRAEQVTGIMDVYEGTYEPSPDLQVGDPPFLSSGGEIVLAGENVSVERELMLRFVLSVPDSAQCPMPAAGYPVAIYAHGTGGDYRSVVRGGTAELLAIRCVASFAIDQLFHGVRPGGPCVARADEPPCNPLPEAYAIFNAVNPTSLRWSNQQAALDLVQQARLVTTSNLEVPADLAFSGQRIVFDPSRVLLRAHSQGATSGALTLAVDGSWLGGAFSGAAAMATVSLLERTQPEDLATLLMSELYGSDAGQPLDVFHPAMSVLQTALDQGDPIHYVDFIARDPRPGFDPKSLLTVEGIGADGTSDSFVSSHAVELLAIAAGVPPILPWVRPIAELDWSDLVATPVPAGGLAGNLAGGAATGALVQWPPPEGSDPHFVVFDLPAAAEHMADFVETLATAPPGSIGVR